MLVSIPIITQFFKILSSSLVILYVWPGNGTGLFLPPQGTHSAVISINEFTPHQEAVVSQTIIVPK